MEFHIRAGTFPAVAGFQQAISAGNESLNLPPPKKTKKQLHKWGKNQQEDVWPQMIAPTHVNLNRNKVNEIWTIPSISKHVLHIKAFVFEWQKVTQV